MNFLLLYISIRLKMRVMMAMVIYASVIRNSAELPSENQAVSENGMDRLR